MPSEHTSFDGLRHLAAALISCTEMGDVNKKSIFTKLVERLDGKYEL
jgi:hypothetical protein